MKFYQTYVKYAILVNERKDTFSTAKVTQNQSFIRRLLVCSD